MLVAVRHLLPTRHSHSYRRLRIESESLSSLSLDVKEWQDPNEEELPRGALLMTLLLWRLKIIW